MNLSHEFGSKIQRKRQSLINKPCLILFQHRLFVVVVLAVLLIVV